MAHRRVREVMTSDVACAHEDTPFKEVTQILAGRGISALPVLDGQGRVSGVVSEVDLLHKEQYKEDGKRQPRLRHPASRAKAAGVTAGDVMTSPAITIGPDATVVEAARSLVAHRIKRMPVVDADGKLVGICSQRDLLRVFLRPDEAIAEDIRTRVFDALGTNPALVQVDVDEGVVTLGGEVGNKSMIALAVCMAQSADSVVDVVNHLTYAVDDTIAPATLSPADVRDARFIPRPPGHDGDDLRRLV